MERKLTGVYEDALELDYVDRLELIHSLVASMAEREARAIDHSWHALAEVKETQHFWEPQEQAV